MRPLKLKLFVGALAWVTCATSARAQETVPAAQPAETWAVHAQMTFETQGVLGFHAPYQGPNSLTPNWIKETFDSTIYLGLRPWAGAETWVNGEIDQGFGLSNTYGVAGFPSAEAYKVGKANPYFKFHRAFLRQTVSLGGPVAHVDAAANQLAGSQTAERVVLTVGKFGAPDIFDTNRYAHDPRADFMNWAAVDAGTFDYAANAWGYSYGAAAEYYHANWTVRAGLFNLSVIPNGIELETNLSQNQILAELEHRHILNGHAGAVRVTYFRNHGKFSRFNDALALAATTGQPLDLSLTRRPQNRNGVHVNIEQELTNTLGVFARAGVADGAIEPYDFTDIDQSILVGGALKGKGWHRADDTIGLAVILNSISHDHQAYLAAGGLGTLVGDGKLPHPGNEAIVEAYYAWHTPIKHLDMTFDYQFIANPGYNRDRGPANVLAIRLHAAI